MGRPQEGHFGLREWEEQGFVPEAVPGHPQPQPLIVRGMHFEARVMTGHESVASMSVTYLDPNPCWPAMLATACGSPANTLSGRILAEPGAVLLR